MEKKKRKGKVGKKGKINSTLRKKPKSRVKMSKVAKENPKFASKRTGRILGVRRIDSGSTHGWYVQIRRGDKSIPSKFFADSLNTAKQRNLALEMAEKHAVRLHKKAPVPKTTKGRVYMNRPISYDEERHCYRVQTTYYKKNGEAVRIDKRIQVVNDNHTKALREVKKLKKQIANMPGRYLA